MPEPLPEDAAERFAQAVCDAEFQCGCGLHASEQECRDEVREAFEAAVTGGVDLDEPCFDAFLASPIFTECTEGGAGAPSCDGPAIVGRADVGEACIGWNLFTMLPGQGCKAGLRCGFDGVCHPMTDGEWNEDPSPIMVGDACKPGFPSCGIGLYCSSVTSTCVQSTPVGESCTQYDECESGAYCMGLKTRAGVCAPRVALGQPCSPADVQPCQEGWCDVTAQVCQEPNPFVCFNQQIRLEQ